MSKWGVMGDSRQSKSAATIPRSAVQDYLDSAIRRWRSIEADTNHKHHRVAPFYVDAFQSARSSLLGETLQVQGQSPQPEGPQDKGPLQPWHSQPNPEEKARFIRQRQRQEGIKVVDPERMSQDARRRPGRR